MGGWVGGYEEVVAAKDLALRHAGGDVGVAGGGGTLGEGQLGVGGAHGLEGEAYLVVVLPRLKQLLPGRRERAQGGQVLGHLLAAPPR